MFASNLILSQPDGQGISQRNQDDGTEDNRHNAATVAVRSLTETEGLIGRTGSRQAYRAR